MLPGVGREAPESAGRLDFVAQRQRHCDDFLSPLADPAGKSVLVAGCGAGTEMVWCLRRGAREVLGIDILEQDPRALQLARRRFGVNDGRRAEIVRREIAEIGSLGRRFDLVLSNNVFEHVADVSGALVACGRALEPGSGRLAIFSDPLFYSSVGSHLEHEPWEHLWADPGELRERLLAREEGTHPALGELDLETFFDREITLNRYRFVDYVEAIRRSGLAMLWLEARLDRNYARFAEFESRIRARCGPEVTTQDLTVEGLGVVLAAGMRPGSDVTADDTRLPTWLRRRLARWIAPAYRF